MPESLVSCQNAIPSVRFNPEGKRGLYEACRMTGILGFPAKAAISIKKSQQGVRNKNKQEAACRKPSRNNELASHGEVTERPKVRHWKCRVVSQPPRVRIPPSPLVGEAVSATRWPLSVCIRVIFLPLCFVLKLC
jgi:hypothetical protein